MNTYSSEPFQNILLGNRVTMVAVIEWMLARYIAPFDAFSGPEIH